MKWNQQVKEEMANTSQDAPPAIEAEATAVNPLFFKTKRIVLFSLLLTNLCFCADTQAGYSGAFAWRSGLRIRRPCGSHLSPVFTPTQDFAATSAA